MHVHHKIAGVLPDDFHYMPERRSLSLYPNWLLGLVAESLPESPMWSAFASISTHNHAAVEDIFGLFPDLRAAREYTALSRTSVCQILGIAYDDLDFIEEGHVPLTVARALELTHSLGWPLAALFRDAERLHHRTSVKLSFREFYG